MTQIARIHRRFYAALILSDLINELPFSELSSKYAHISDFSWLLLLVPSFLIFLMRTRYGVARGILQGLQTTGATFAGMVSVFCQRLGWWDMHLLISQFTDRLNFGAQMDILPLVQIPEMKNFHAR